MFSSLVPLISHVFLLSSLAFSKLALKKGFRPIHTKVLVTGETQNNLLIYLHFNQR